MKKLCIFDHISTLLISHIFTKVYFFVYGNRDLPSGNTFTKLEEIVMNNLVAMATKTFKRWIFVDSVNLAIFSSEVSNIVPIFIKFMSNDNFDMVDQTILLGYHDNHV